ncbi:hypothetical protein [Pengzhenrongella sp.]|uniref:hypothetical protein n=1 Tax=Pengzhenrongella sp. TaxID=2888820 RepID=UPI002F954D52
MTAPLVPSIAASSRARSSGSVRRRARAALVFAVVGLALITVSALLPWVTLFHGLQPIRGFRLDGGDLAGFAVASVALAAVAARHGGGRILRPLAVTGAIVVMAGSLNSARLIAAYVADPGPTGALVGPVAGFGPLVMAAGGLTLLAASLVGPAHDGRMRHGLPIRVVMAAATFVAAWMHFVLTPEHLGQSTLLGLGFLAAGIVQLVLCVVVVERPGSAALSVLVMVNVALLVIWAYAVLVGLPIGGEGQHAASGLVVGSGEPIDLAAAITKVAELVSLSIALVLMRALPPKPLLGPG